MALLGLPERSDDLGPRRPIEGGRAESVRLPNIQLKNIGRKAGAATPDQGIAALASGVSGSVGNLVTPSALDAVTGAALGGAAGAMDVLEKGAVEDEDTLKKMLAV